MAFVKRVEDFTCEHCGERVSGTGYTNHCPKCLWSKHVDIDPGDRMEVCGGMMKPTRLELISGKYSILHQCVNCGHQKRNKKNENDDQDTLIALSRRKF